MKYYVIRSGSWLNGHLDFFNMSFSYWLYPDPSNNFRGVRLIKTVKNDV